MTKNLTQGNPLKLITEFALPLLAGNLFQQAYNMADSAIVGHYLGPLSLAGVGASSSVQFLVLGFCTGTCVGTAIPVAQRFGANDLSDMRRCIFIGLVSLLGLSIIIAAFCALFCPAILRLLATPDDIFGDAYSYLFVIFLGIPFTMLYNALSGIMRAAGDSRTPFYFLLIAVTLNIGLDLLFIIVFGMGVFGAALATIISQGVSGALCAVFIIFKSKVLVPKKEDCVWSWVSCKNILFIGVPMGLQFSITAVGSMVMQAANNGLGSFYVSSFTAATKIKQLMICPFNAIGSAVSTFASQNYGAGELQRIRKGILQGTIIATLAGAVLGLISIFFGRSMCLMFVSSSEKNLLDAAGQYLRIIGYFYWAMGILIVLRTTVQGLGFTRRMLVAGVIEMLARTFVSFAFVPALGYTAICIADPSAWLSALVYIIPTLFWCIHHIEKIVTNRRNVYGLRNERT